LFPLPSHITQLTIGNTCPLLKSVSILLSGLCSKQSLCCSVHRQNTVLGARFKDIFFRKMYNITFCDEKTYSTFLSTVVVECKSQAKIFTSTPETFFVTKKTKESLGTFLVTKLGLSAQYLAIFFHQNTEKYPYFSKCSHP